MTVKSKKAVQVSIIDEISDYLNKYMIMSQDDIFIISTWVVSSWLYKLWDRFPHLIVLADSTRCGKTKLLELLSLVTNNSHINSIGFNTKFLSRFTNENDSTLLFDNITKINPTQLRLIILSIDHDYEIYYPKVICLSGIPLHYRLNDKCLPVSLHTKRKDQITDRVRFRRIEEGALILKDKIADWVKNNKESVDNVYYEIPSVEVDNYATQDSLRPLQAVLHVMYPEGGYEEMLLRYAKSLGD